MSERVEISINDCKIRSVQTWIINRFEVPPRTFGSCMGGHERSNHLMNWLYTRGLIVPSEYNLRNGGICGFSYYNLYEIRTFNNIDLAILCNDWAKQQLFFSERERVVLGEIPIHLYVSGSWNDFAEFRKCTN